MALPNIATITIDQLARECFRYFRENGRPGEVSRYLDFNTVADALAGGRSSQKFEDAWFRLVDRGLIRWRSGGDYSQWYMLTERGRTSRFHELAIDGPDEELARLVSKTGPLDAVLDAYLAEAIRALRVDLVFSAQLALGIAAEQVAYLLQAWLLSRSNSKKLAHPPNAAALIDECIVELEAVRKTRSGTPDEQAIRDMAEHMELLADVFRLSRNGVAHPKVVPEHSADSVATQLGAVLRTYVPALYEVLRLP